MPSPDRWLFPNDSQVDRARRIALAYRDIITMTLAVFTDENGRLTDGRIEDLRTERDRLDKCCIEFGQSWVVRTRAPIDPEDFRPRLKSLSYSTSNRAHCETCTARATSGASSATARH